MVCFPADCKIKIKKRNRELSIDDVITSARFDWPKTSRDAGAAR